VQFANTILRLKVVALETAGSGVTCNAVSPGFVDTPSMFTTFYTGMQHWLHSFPLAQIALSDLRKCSDRSDKSAKIKNASDHSDCTLLFGHIHTTHSAVKYINVYVNIYDVAVVFYVVPWV